ncbi:hypothetical protein [Inhella crocodyli]|uniref:Uncharacterized protein n=1 Tax=Inhella crocodyli TaxID=2499851 RepID=A0A3S2UKM0_9BURK|nr:hypothetical protein [Inhella crocodyli]RVT88341.1 hypothetical protein EOD73_04980 [Inhella crocodyli]
MTNKSRHALATSAAQVAEPWPPSCDGSDDMPVAPKLDQPSGSQDLPTGWQKELTVLLERHSSLGANPDPHSMPEAELRGLYQYLARHNRGGG